MYFDDFSQFYSYIISISWVTNLIQTLPDNFLWKYSFLPLFVVLLSMVSVTQLQPLSESRWSSFWLIQRSILASQCLHYSPHFISSLRHFIISHLHRRNDNGTIRHFEKERNHSHITFPTVYCYNFFVFCYCC